MIKRIGLLCLLMEICIFTQAKDNNVYTFGGINRTDPGKKQITLIFTGADRAEGAPYILDILKNNKIKAAFFLTGKFYERFPDVIADIRKDGHYLGSHGYAHLLYSSWENRDSMLVTREQFVEDTEKSYSAMAECGIKRKDAPYFIPSFEHYNDTVSRWTREIGLHLINCTYGTASAADYTTPDMKNYRSSENIYNNIMEVEEKNGLNGHLMLFHIGTVDARTDKMYKTYLDKVIKELKNRGYKFVPLKKAIGKVK